LFLSKFYGVDPKNRLPNLHYFGSAKPETNNSEPYLWKILYTLKF